MNIFLIRGPNNLNLGNESEIKVINWKRCTRFKIWAWEAPWCWKLPFASRRGFFCAASLRLRGRHRACRYCLGRTPLLLRPAPPLPRCRARNQSRSFVEVTWTNKHSRRPTCSISSSQIFSFHTWWTFLLLVSAALPLSPRVPKRLCSFTVHFTVFRFACKISYFW